MTMYVTPSGQIYPDIKFCVGGCRQCDPEQRKAFDFCSVCRKDIVQSEDKVEQREAARHEAEQIAVSIETAKREAARREAKQREAARHEAEQREAKVIIMVNKSQPFLLSPFFDITKEELFARIKKNQRLFVEYQGNDPLLIKKTNKIFQFQRKVIYFAEFAKYLENHESKNWDDFYSLLETENTRVKDFILKFWPEIEKPPPIPPRRSRKKKRNDSKFSRMPGRQTEKLAENFGKQVKPVKSSK